MCNNTRQSEARPRDDIGTHLALLFEGNDVAVENGIDFDAAGAFEVDQRTE